MSNWHYQVLYYDMGEDSGYGIHEYYPEVDEVLSSEDTYATGHSALYTAQPVRVYAESIEELKAILHHMLSDIDKYGIINYDSGEKM